MRTHLLKHWFLIALLGGVCIAYWFPQGLRPFTQRLEPRVMVALALFLMAWGLETRSLLQAFLRPYPVIWAIVISYGFLPALAWLAGRQFLSPDLRVGLLIVASVPCTLASAVLWTRLAGGNEAVALLVVLLTTGMSWLVTTGWLTLATAREIALDAIGMMQSLFVVLMVPVGFGQAVRAVGVFRRTARHYKHAFSVISRILILSIVLKAAVDVADKLRAESALVAPGELIEALLLCIGIHLAALCTGFWGGKILRFDLSNRIAVAFACSQKTLPVSLYLFDSYFKDTHPLAVVPLLFYHFGQLVVDTFVADKMAHQDQTETVRKRIVRETSTGV